MTFLGGCNAYAAKLIREKSFEGPWFKAEPFVSERAAPDKKNLKAEGPSGFLGSE